jgi:hypothetical protein
MKIFTKAVLRAVFSPLREALRREVVPTRSEIWRYGI